MWVDEQGVLHTVSAPDPAVVIGRWAHLWIRTLGPKRRAEVRAWVEHRTEDILEQEHVRLGTVGAPGQLPPRPMLGRVASFGQLVRADEAVPLAWRLDVLSTLDEHL